MGKFKQRLVLSFFLMISFNSFSQFPYYEPEPYFPIYPGSHWRYITSAGDTVISKSDDQYRVIDGRGFLPYFNNIVYNGYKTLCYWMGPHWVNFLFYDILNFEMVIECDSRYCDNEVCNFLKVVAVDTSITIFNKTYDSVVIIKHFEKAGRLVGTYPSAKKSGTYEYYAKNIGLIKLTSYDSTGTEKTEKELLDYKIVKKKFQTIQFNIPDTLEVYKNYKLNITASSGLPIYTNDTLHLFPYPYGRYGYCNEIKGDSIKITCGCYLDIYTTGNIYRCPEVQITAMQPGNDEYYVVVKDTLISFFIDPSSIPLDTVPGINTVTGIVQKSQIPILCYPTIVKDLLTVNNQFKQSKISISMYKVSGEIVKNDFVFNTDMENLQINVNSLVPGFYIIKFIDGDSIYNSYFIKE